MLQPTTMRTVAHGHFLGRTGMIIGLYGVVFHGEDARDALNCVALQNNMKNLEQLGKICQQSGQELFSGVEK